MFGQPQMSRSRFLCLAAASSLAAQRLIEAVPSCSERFARAPVQRIDSIGPRRRHPVSQQGSAAAAAQTWPAPRRR